MSDARDKIIDAALQEVLGGHTPPDLADRLLPELGQADIPAEPIAPPVQRQSASAPKRPRTRFAAQRWLVLAASLMIVATAVWVAVRSQANRQIARATDPQHAGTAANDAPGPDATNHPVARQARPGRRPEPVDPADTEITRPSRPPFADQSPPTVEEALGQGRQQPAAPWQSERVVAAINQSVRTLWEQHAVDTSAEIDDQAWTQRLVQTLLGRQLEPDEIQRLISPDQPLDRPALVDQLLDDPTYHDEFARHWGSLWADEFAAVDAVRARALLESYLQDALGADKGLDRIAREMLTATGSTNGRADNFNPALGFLLARQDPRAVSTTAHVAQSLMGQRIDCVQCHDSKVAGNDWTQDRFWKLNAFFRQMQVTQGGGARALTDRSLRSSGNQGREAEVFYADPEEMLHAVFPEFVDGTTIARSGRLEDVNRRAELARLMSGSDEFRRSIVNRAWSHVFSVGLVNPVDDMGPHNQAADPALLETLATQFAAHGHDLRALLRWYVLSDPFTRPTATLSQQPERTRGGHPLLATFQPARKTRVDFRQAISHLASLELDSTSQAARLSNGAQGRVNPEIVANQTGLAISPSPYRDTDFLERVLGSEMPLIDQARHVFYEAAGREPSRQENMELERIVSSQTGDIRLRLLWQVLAR